MQIKHSYYIITLNMNKFRYLIDNKIKDIKLRE